MGLDLLQCQYYVKLAVALFKIHGNPFSQEICDPPYIAKPLTAITPNILSNADTESYTSITSESHISSIAEIY